MLPIARFAVPGVDRNHPVAIPHVVAGTAPAGVAGDEGKGVFRDRRRRPVRRPAEQIALLTSEAEQGGRDLNGDRDAEDMVVQRYDPARRVLSSLRLAAAGLPLLTPNRLACLVPERDQGNADMNGDHDADDQVAALFTPAANHLVSTRQATCGIFALSERALVFFTPNADESATPCQLFRIR